MKSLVQGDVTVFCRNNMADAQEIPQFLERSYIIKLLMLFSKKKKNPIT